MLNLQSLSGFERPSALSLFKNGALFMVACLVIRVCRLPIPYAVLADGEN